MAEMDSKSELLVFNKKEILVILALLVLVALFSFTLGLRLGKTLGVAAAPVAEQKPLGEHGEHHEEHAPAATEAGHGEQGEAAHGEAQEETHATAEPAKAEKDAPKPGAGAEDKADAEFAHETAKEKVAVAKPVPMALPKEKKGESHADVSYTLQVGSHRTVAEAAEQVTLLKRNGLEAFYIEAKVPGKGTWYRVGVGLFPSKEIAEKSAAKWKSSKALPPYIVQKISE